MTAVPGLLIASLVVVVGCGASKSAQHSPAPAAAPAPASAPRTAEPPQSLVFDYETYNLAYETTVDGATLWEYLRPGDTTKKWQQMISVRTHPNASRLSDVMEPYAEARQSLWLYDPPIYKPDESDHAEELVFEFLLGSPDGSFAEFVLVRGARDDGKPVMLYVFSRRHVFGSSFDEERYIARINLKRSDWLRSLGELRVSNTED